MKHLRKVLPLAALLVCLLSVSAIDVNNTREYWAKVNNGPTRFEVLNDFNGEAVLDNETGHVDIQLRNSCRTRRSRVLGEQV